MKKATIIGLLALMVVGMISTVSAYRGDYSVKGPDYTDERHELMETVFDNADYDAWLELMSENGRNSRVMQVVTAENFQTFVDAHEAADNGDFEKAAELRAELGLNNGHGPMDGTGFRGMGQNKGHGMQDGLRGQGCDGSRMRRTN